jgi:hypothetical protein
MARSDAKDSGEKLQIAILTLAMTGAGFALVTLIFVLFINPSASDRAARAAGDYAKLHKLLTSQEMQELRATAKRSAGQDNTKTLTDIVVETLSTYGLEYKSIKPAVTKSIKPGLDEVRQSLGLQPASLVAILQYVATVESAKRTFQTLSLDLTHSKKKRSAPEDELWVANVEFRDYVSK